MLPRDLCLSYERFAPPLGRESHRNRKLEQAALYAEFFRGYGAETSLFCPEFPPELDA